MRNFLYRMALLMVERTAPKKDRSWGVLLRMHSGGTVTFDGMDEAMATALCEAYNVGHDARVAGSRLIIP